MTTPEGSNGNYVLVHKHVFGLKVRNSPCASHSPWHTQDKLAHLRSSVSRQADVKDHLQYLDENNVVYPCGHNTVVYNTETREQSLIHGIHAGTAVEKGATSQDSEGITALAVTPNRRYIGVAERCVDRGVVNIFDAQSYRRRRVLNYAELGSKEVVCVAFSADSKQVLMLGGAPDWTLVLWSTDRTAKVVASMKLGGHGGGAPGQATGVRDACSCANMWMAAISSSFDNLWLPPGDDGISREGRTWRCCRDFRSRPSCGHTHSPGRLLPVGCECRLCLRQRSAQNAQSHGRRVSTDGRLAQTGSPELHVSCLASRGPARSRH